MRVTEVDAAVAEFIHRKGITRCPTACVSPTQASLAAADRAALEEHASMRDRLRRAKIAVHARSFAVPGPAING